MNKDKEQNSFMLIREAAYFNGTKFIQRPQVFKDRLFPHLTLPQWSLQAPSDSPPNSELSVNMWVCLTEEVDDRDLSYLRFSILTCPPPPNLL
jgi:hypothetical protein